MKRSHIYFEGDLEAIVRNDIRPSLARLSVRCGGAKKAAKSLKCDVSDVKLILNSSPLPNYEEPQIFELTEEDLQSYSLSRLMRMVRAAIVIAVAHLGVPDDIALFLGIKEDQVRRHQKAAVRLLGSARLAALSSRDTTT